MHTFGESNFAIFSYAFLLKGITLVITYQIHSVKNESSLEGLCHTGKETVFEDKLT